MRQNKGFSLVELMIVVAIIGILAAIAIPNFVAMQSKSKRAEVPGYVDAIKTAELSYDASFDSFLAAASYPGGSLNKNFQDWDYAGSGGFKTMGWQPDGQVRGNYEVTGVTSTDFLVHGSCDVDDDNAEADYTATKTANSKLDAGDEDIY